MWDVLTRQKVGEWLCLEVVGLRLQAGVSVYLSAMAVSVLSQLDRHAVTQGQSRHGQLESQLSAWVETLASRTFSDI